MKHLFSVLIILSLAITSCVQDFPIDKNLKNVTTNLIDQNGNEKYFNKVIAGKTTVIAFIYTNCPDICPMTTHDMQLVDEKFLKENITNINFVVVSFDPERDTPEVLNKFAAIRDIDLKRWGFYTGDKTSIEELMDEFEVKAFPSDTSYSSEGKLRYSMIHTDRISLIDSEGRLRKYYSGSKLNLDELYNDIKKLED